MSTPEPIEDPDVKLVAVAVGPSTPVTSPGDITVAVSVQANHNAFQDETAYRLYIFLCCCHGSHESTPPIFKHGHLGDSSWPTEDYTFHCSFTVNAADPCPDVCTVKVVLLEGGVHDTDSVPSFKESGPILVVCPPPPPPSPTPYKPK